MNEERISKNYQKHPDRVTLGTEALVRVNGWLEQVRSNLRGIRMSRNDLVEHVILSQPAELPASVVAELKESRFDEVAFTAWALRELKAARARGEKLTLADVVNGAHLSKEPRPRRRRSSPLTSQRNTVEPESVESSADATVLSSVTTSGDAGTFTLESE